MYFKTVDDFSRPKQSRTLQKWQQYLGNCSRLSFPYRRQAVVFSFSVAVRFYWIFKSHADRDGVRQRPKIDGAAIEPGRPLVVGVDKTGTHVDKCVIMTSLPCAFGALTLLVGRQEGHPACKN